MNNNRRDFIKQAGLFTALSAIGTTIPSALSIGNQKELFLNNTEHKLPKLPYDFDALEPVIDAKTVEIHYTKHHQGYVNGLNKAEAKITDAMGRKDYSEIDYWTKKMAFTGAGNFLHTLYWNSMSENGGGKPKTSIMDRMKIDFGSFDNFKSYFSSVTAKVEGSGWGILAMKPETKQLIILQAENHQKLTTWDIVPIMALDVWEHAYYLKYQNHRKDYIKEWWNIVNWDNVEKNYNLHIQNNK